MGVDEFGRIMERISAASNIIIEVQPQSWRLLTNGGDSERILVEAVSGEPLRYGASFGSRRHLPDGGSLPREDVQRVVLGWSEKDDAWHLGLVLRGDLVEQRGSRWCGLAHWYDPLANQYQAVAVQAGQTLAEQMERPFTLIPPNASETSTTAPTATQEMSAHARIEATTLEPLAEPIPQPDLPLTFDLWSLQQTAPDRLELILSPAWGRGKLVRVAWNIVWLGVFIILTGTTLTSGIALPRPEILVYFGFASIILLILLIFYNLYETMTAINRIVFEQAGVRWLRGTRVRRTLPIDQIQEIYVSLVINKVAKRGKGSQRRGVQYGEISLSLTDTNFRSVLIQRQTDDTIPVTDDPLDDESIAPLTEYNARTRLQSAALKLAAALGVSPEYDKRLK